MADFNEVAEQLRKFSEELRDSLEVELTQEHAKFAQNLTRQAQIRVGAQKEFAKQLGEEELINRQIDLFKRKQAIQDAKKLVTTKLETDALQRQAKGIDVLLSETEKLKETVEAQVNAYGLASGLTQEITTSQKRTLEMMIDTNAILQGQTTLVGQQREDRLQQLRLEEDIVKKYEEGTDEIDLQKRLNKSILGDLKVFGKSFNDMKSDLVDMVSTPGGLAKALIAVLLVGLAKLNQVVQELADTGLTVRQTFDAVGQTINVMATGGLDNLLAWKDTFKAVQGLRSQFADLRFQTDEMVENTQDLVTFFRLTGQEAAQVSEILTKVGGLSAQQQDDFQKSARAFARINDLNPASVMRAVAQNARQFALAGADGANEFIRAVGAADRLGVSLEKIEGIRDNVLDIDKLFSGVAELRTLGIDIPDPAVLAQAAQFEGPQGFVRELQRQLQATGRELSREGLGGTIQVGKLEQLFGLDLAEMNKILNEGATSFEDATQAQVDAEKSVQDQVATGLLAFAKSINVATIAMVAFAAFMGKDILLSAGRTAMGLLRGGGAVAGGAGMAGFQATSLAGGAAAGGAGIGARALGGAGRLARVGGRALGFAGLGIGGVLDVKDIVQGEAAGEDARAKGIGGIAGMAIGGGLGGAAGLLTGGVASPALALLGANIGNFVGRGIGDYIGNFFGETTPGREAIEAEAQQAIEGEIPPSAVSDAALQLAATQQALTELQLREFQKVTDEATQAKLDELISIWKGGVAVKIDPDGVGQMVVRSFGHSVG